MHWFVRLPFTSLARLDFQCIFLPQAIDRQEGNVHLHRYVRIIACAKSDRWAQGVVPLIPESPETPRTWSDWCRGERRARCS